MSKPKFKRSLGDNCAVASIKSLRVSPQKLNLLAGLIRGKLASKALRDLSFASQRVAQDVKKLLMSAIANAEVNHDLDIDCLVVQEATVGRDFVLKRSDIRGRSKVGRITKPFSNMRIVVREEKE
ncbi:MAG: 50S ribosomal protein L22 [Alphaproteobacteria bacterium]